MEHPECGEGLEAECDIIATFPTATAKDIDLCSSLKRDWLATFDDVPEAS